MKLDAFTAGIGRPSNPFSIYYGVNISPYKEPLDQFDPLLLIRLWNRMLQKDASNGDPAPHWKLAVFVAGKYRLLNLREDQEPFSRVKQWEVEELRKKSLFERAARGLGMEEEVSVFITDQLWEDTRYWQALCLLIERKADMPNLRAFRDPDKAVQFGDLPRYLLGGITDSQRERLACFKGCELYLYAELAEAYFLRDVYGVAAKIGPQSEEEYDRYLRPDFSIVQMKNPLALDSRPGREMPAIPYIGLRGEERIWDKDFEIKPGENPLKGAIVVESKFSQASDYPGGPLDQYRARLELGSRNGGESLKDVADIKIARGADGIANLSRMVYDYAEQVFGAKGRSWI